MKTKILMPAHNEAQNIGNTLSRLSSELFEPIVILNGCNDGSRRVAEDYGVKIYDFEEKGKLPALQSTLRSLGHEALEPLLVLDADTRPILPTHWNNTFMKALFTEDRPTYVSAPVIFTPREEGVVGERTFLTLFRYFDGAIRRRKNIENADAAYYGPNQAFRLFSTKTLDDVVDLPHYWPKEDVAMARTIVGDGEGVMRQLLDLRAATLSQVSSAMPPLYDWVIKNPSVIDQEIIERYRLNAPSTSMPYPTQTKG